MELPVQIQDFGKKIIDLFKRHIQNIHLLGKKRTKKCEYVTNYAQKSPGHTNVRFVQIITSHYSTLLLQKVFRANSHGGPKSREVNPCNLNRWERGNWDLPLHTESQVPSPRSQVWRGCLHGNTFWKWGLDLCCELGQAKSYNLTLNPSLADIFP